MLRGPNLITQTTQCSLLSTLLLLMSCYIFFFFFSTRSSIFSVANLTINQLFDSNTINHLKHKRRVFAATFLVPPMSCKPKFCLQMHLMCTYLDFKWNCSIVHQARKRI
ncbi:hypothetical protein ISN44_As08g008520 [Arabidopsis suecica]|uniref:Uncharacterized protein n=1 Tax=Arabidopsis suecica TaxID=45249 RepID=A0A8T2B6E4_ARASU|nr:hypothetical protein ISN44_As08g008520 [Arabidopsis suecica]